MRLNYRYIIADILSQMNLSQKKNIIMYDLHILIQFKCKSSLHSLNHLKLLKTKEKRFGLFQNLIAFDILNEFRYVHRKCWQVLESKIKLMVIL